MDLVGTTTDLFENTWSTVTSLSIDFFILLAIFLFFILYAFYFGKERIITFILSLYVAAFLFPIFPYIESVLIFTDSPLQVVLSKVSIFVAFALVANIIIGRFTFSEFSRNTFYGWFETFLLSFSATALLLVFSYHILPITEVYDFNPYLDIIFEPAKYLFWWLALPFIGLILTSKG